MPVIPSAYAGGPFYLFNGHVQTIIPGLFREVKDVYYRRERILLPDGDFLDLDWSEVGSSSLAIISHGLEGSADRPYIKGMVKEMNRAGLDALAWNFRSCSGESNKLLRMYHMGASDDLHLVVEHVLSTHKYQQIYLLGFSMGGNITLHYLGKYPDQVPKEVKRAVVFSVPCHISSASKKMASWENQVYMQRFLKSLHQKLTDKLALMPDEMNLEGFKKLKSFPEFDERFTAPIHGYKSAEEYYESCSSRQFLPQIRIPTLLVNARNDPFLSPECFPVPEAKTNPYFYLEMPLNGGHGGFTINFRKNLYYPDLRAVEFITTNL